jgi:hypothetical protein
VIWDEKMEFLRQYVSAHPLTQMPLPSEKRPDPANLQEPAWLARNQETDGSWAVKRWEGTGDEGNRVGVTGLAVLAFLSNGMTEKTGDLKEHVRLATGYLTRCQQADGRIGVADPTEVLCMFNHATAGLALSEAFAMSRFRETGLAAGRALTWTQQNQHPGGGWPRSVGGAPDFDMSVLCMLQIRSGSLAGLEVDRSAMLRGRDWILKSADSSDDRGHRAAGAIVALYTTGSKKDDCAAWGEILIAEAKADDQSRAPRQLASWWESLPAFVFVRELAQAYGESDRDRIAGLRIVRLDGSPLHLSWDPSGGATPFGRAYSTAAAHLALTLYYRYLPIQK